MFGPGMGTPGLSFGKVLGGISKTLGVVNQIIPLYKEAKPMINNARTAFSIIKEFGNSTTNHVLQTTEKNLKPIKDKINKERVISTNLSNQKGPTFFQ